MCFRDFVVDPFSQLSVARNCAEVGMIANVLESPLPANQAVFNEKDTGQQPGIPDGSTRPVPFLHRLQCLHPDSRAEDLTQTGFAHIQQPEDLTLRIGDCTSLRPEFIEELSTLR